MNELTKTKTRNQICVCVQIQTNSAYKQETNELINKKNQMKLQL